MNKKFKLNELEGIFGGRLLTKNQTNSSGKYLYLTPRHVQDKKILSLKEKDRFVDEETFTDIGLKKEKTKDYFEKFLLKPGDILVSTIFPKRKVYQIKKNDPKCFAGNNWIILRTKINDYLGDYLSVAEFYKNFEFQCEKRLKGEVIPFLSAKELGEVEILKISHEKLKERAKEENRDHIKESKLLNSLKKGKLNETQQDFLSDLVKEFYEHPILKLLKREESFYLEKKATFKKDIEKGGKVPESEMVHNVMKTIGAFCNSGGGDILIGVTDDHKVIGIEADDFENTDKFLQSLTQQIANCTNPNVNDFLDVLNITTLKSENKTICRIQVQPTPKNVYVLYRKKEVFYRREGPKSKELEGRKLEEYIEEKKKKFS